MFKEKMSKIKEWWENNGDGIVEGIKYFCVGAGIGLAALSVGGALYTAGYRKATTEMSVDYALVCARNPEIKTLTDKAAEEVKEMLSK